jgi:hypothetical protein
VLILTMCSRADTATTNSTGSHPLPTLHTPAAQLPALQRDEEPFVLKLAKVRA